MENENEIRARLDEKVIRQQTVYHGVVANYDIWDVTLPDGRPAKREIIRHPGAAAVVPVDENGNVTMVYQYRHPLQRVTLEIPADKKEIGEDPLECARRELREEVGIIAGQYRLLTHLASSPGIFDERIWIYLATDLSYCQTDPDDDEFLNIRVFPLEELIKRIVNNEIQDSKTIAGLMLAREVLK